MDILVEKYNKIVPGYIYHFNYDIINDSTLNDISKISNKYITNINIHYFNNKLLDSQFLKFINDNNIQLWLHLDKTSNPELIHHYGIIDKLTINYDITDDTNLDNLEEMKKLYFLYQSYLLDIRMVFGKKYTGNIIPYLDEKMTLRTLDILDELIYSIYQYFYRFYYNSINYIPYYLFRLNENNIFYFNNSLQFDDFIKGTKEIEIIIPDKCIKCEVNDICPKIEYFINEDCYKKYGPTLKLMKKKFFREEINQNNGYINTTTTKKLKNN